MSKQVALLEFSIMFDPSETWSHMYEFEATFAAYLKSIGLEAEVMMPVGQGTRRVIYISKLPDIEPQVPAPPAEVKGPKEALNDLKKGLK